MEVYHKLDVYTSNSIKNYGKQLMRNNKLVFYYLLMIKFLLQFKLRSAATVFSMLAKYDNIILLSYYFTKLKLLKLKSQSTPLSFYNKQLQIGATQK
jgi:hypothetical protein